MYSVEGYGSGNPTYMYGTANLIPKYGTTFNLVYAELVESAQPNQGHKYITALYSSADIKPNTAAVQSSIPVTGYQVGGVRPTFPSRGNVWFPVANSRVQGCYIYSGAMWESVGCRYYTGTRWIPIYAFDIVTLQDCWDVSDVDPSAPAITSETGFWSWWQKAWLDFRQWLSTAFDRIIAAISGAEPSEPGEPSPGSCEHEYAKTETQSATCTTPGATQYLCSKCGDIRVETIPALGHDWVCVDSIPDTAVSTATLARWDFASDTFPAVVTSGEITDAVVGAVGVSGVAYMSASASIYASGWNGAGASDRYWLITMRTTSYQLISISFVSWGDSAGPSNFSLEYSADGGDWLQVVNYAVTTTATTSYRYDLPPETGGVSSLKIRLRAADNIAVNGGAVGSTGRNYISSVSVVGAAAMNVIRGYDLYRCTLCGEEYRDYTRTGPPNEDDGGGFKLDIFGFLSLLGKVVGGAWTFVTNMSGLVFNGMFQQLGSGIRGFTDAYGSDGVLRFYYGGDVWD